MNNSSILTTDQQEIEADEDERELEAIIREARRRARRRRLKIALTGLGVVLVAGLAVLLVASDGLGVGGAGDSGSATGSTGPVDHTRVEILNLMTTGSPDRGVYSLRGHIVKDVWVGDDGSGHVRQRSRPSQWPGPADRRRAMAAGDRRSLAQAEGRRLPEPTDEELSAVALNEDVGLWGFPPAGELPAEPAALSAALLGAEGSERSLPRNQNLFELAGRVALAPNADPAVRAAAFGLIEGLAGVRVDRSAVDPRGRESIALSFSPRRKPPETMTLYVDPETKLAWAEEERFDRRVKGLDSLLLGMTILSKTRTVDSVPAPPAP